MINTAAGAEKRARDIAAAVSALLGGAVLAWASGMRILDPREFGWVMKGDWQIHFLGWHFFRREAWQWPPGAISSFYEPLGTTLGYTDSIPIVAILLKPFAAWLPDPFQYLGLWFLLCFTLQGFFGARAISTWTPRPSLQIVGAMFLVFLPALFARIVHPALCAHWLVLWALWLNWRERDSDRNDVAHHVALGLTSGLVHPYLAVMVFGLLVAVACRRVIERTSWSHAALSLGLAGVALCAGWWASGLFMLSSSRDLPAAGGDFSMNLLSLFDPGPHSAFFPGFPLFSGNQWDAYEYLGLGGFVLCAAAAPLAITHRGWSRSSIPLGVVLVGFALFSVLPLVAVGRHVLLDLRQELGTIAVFRATGRFFWPVAYALMTAAIGLVASRLKPRVTTAFLCGAFVLQLADLRHWWLDVHNGARSQEFFEWSNPMSSAEWGELLPHYRHLRLYSPEYCRGPVPVSGAVAAFHAGLYGMGVNDGFAARVDALKQSAACQRFREDFLRGLLDDSTVYLLAPPYAAEFKARTGDAAECREIDAVTVCVSSRSVAVRSRAQPTGRNQGP